MNRRMFLAGALALPFVDRSATTSEPVVRQLTFEQYGWTYNRGDEAYIFPDLPLVVGETLRIEGFNHLMHVVGPAPYGSGYFVREARHDPSPRPRRRRGRRQPSQHGLTILTDGDRVWLPGEEVA